MKHLIITIELPVDESMYSLTEQDAKEAAKQAHKAARSALPQFTPYDEDDFSYKIED